MKSKLTALIVTILAAIPVAGQTAAEVIDRSLKAIGSERDRMKTGRIIAVADCIGPNGGYTTELDSAVGPVFMFRQTLADGRVYSGFENGSVRWSQSASNEPNIADVKTAFVWHSHDYQRLALEIGKRFSATGTATEARFGPHDASKLEARDELGNTAALYFSRDNGLLVGFDLKNPFADGNEAIRTVFTEWNRVNGLLLPSLAVVTDKSGDFTLRFRTIRISQNSVRAEIPLKVRAMVEILEAHNRARAAHFARDAKMLVESFADEMADLSNGRIVRPSRDESRARFEKYFAGAEFIEWDDLEPPVIRVSDDATLAYTLVRKRVKLRSKDALGTMTETTTDFSWIATYRKINGVWKMTAIASTRSAG